MEKEMVDITLNVKIKGCDEVFNDELGPGVISTKTLSFPKKEIEEKGEARLAAFLLEEKRIMIEDCIEVTMEEEKS